MAPTENGGLQEVVVTATRRSQNLQQIPTSVIALGAAQLKDLGVTTTTKIAEVVAGLQLVSPNSGTDTFFSIRGATQYDYTEHQESPVAVYIDGVYQSQSSGIASLLFDTERVEVLRGPQGTLFGRNATAGLVQYISKAPTDHPDGYAQATFGNYNAKHFEGAYGQQIIPGISFRISAATDYADAFLTNTSAAPGDNPDNSNSRAIRAQFLFQPIDNLDVTINLHGTNSRVRAGFYKDLISFPDPNNHNLATIIPANYNYWQTCPGCDPLGYKVPAGNDYYTGGADVIGHNWESTLGSTGTIKYHFGDDYTLTSISDLTKYNKDYTEDSESSPLPDSTFWTAVNTTQLSEELHIDNGSADRFRWLAGVYYLSIHGRYREGAGTAPGVLLNPVVQDEITQGLLGTNLGEENNYSITTESWSEFAQAEYDILPALTGVLGLRWSDEEKTYNYRFQNLTSYQEYSPVDTTVAPLDINPTTAPDGSKISKGDWSAKVALNWHVTKAIMPYISWSKGVKPGGFNAPLYPLGSTDQYRFNEEKIYASEGGIKSEFFDHRVRLNADVFYYDYVGYQALNTVGSSTYITNNAAKMTGGELEALYQPISGLVLRTGLAVLNAQINGIALPDGTRATRKTAQAPRYNITGGVNYDWEPGFIPGSLDIGTDFSWRSSYYYDLANDPSALQPAYWIQNAHARYITEDGHWSIEGFVDNLLDKHFLTNVIADSPVGWSQGVYGMPLTFGFRLGYQL